MAVSDAGNQMVERTDAAACYHRHAYGIGDSAGEIHVEAGFGAVAVHRGQQDFPRPIFRHPARPIDDIRKLLQCGADKVSINTAAVAKREFVKEAAEKFGNQCIVVAVDAKKVSKPGEAARWEIFTHGGRNPTGLDAIDYAREVVALGAGEILLTSMDRDGTKNGYDIPLTRAIADAVPVPVIASGGVGTLDHLVEGIRDGHATAVLAASIFHFGEYTVRAAKEHMARAGLPMRLDP